MHIIRALSMLICCMQLVTVIHSTNRNNNTDWDIPLFVLCISSFTIMCHFSFVSCVTSYTQFRKNSDNVHKDEWNKVLCTHLLYENTSKVRHVGHDSFPLASRDSLSQKNYAVVWKYGFERFSLSSVETKSCWPRSGSGNSCLTVGDDAGHGSCRLGWEKLVRR